MPKTNKKITEILKYWRGVLFYHFTFYSPYFFTFFIKFETLYILHFLSASLVQMPRGRARVSKLWSPWVAGGRDRLGFTGRYVMPGRNSIESRISQLQISSGAYLGK